MFESSLSLLKGMIALYIERNDDINNPGVHTVMSDIVLQEEPRLEIPKRATRGLEISRWRARGAGLWP